MNLTIIEKRLKVNSMGLERKLGSFFYQKYLLLQFLHRQETLLRQVSCLDDNVGIVE